MQDWDESPVLAAPVGSALVVIGHWYPAGSKIMEHLLRAKFLSVCQEATLNQKP